MKTFFLASSRLLSARVQKPAPDFAGTAVIDNDFKDIKLSDYKGKYLVCTMAITIYCAIDLRVRSF